MSNKLEYMIFGGLLVAMFVTLLAILMIAGNQAEADEFPPASTIIPLAASSTKFTFSIAGGSSVQILASSTKRAAAILQTDNCTTGAVVYLAYNGVNAATSTGISLHASSTLALGSDIPNIDAVVKAMTAVGTCNLLVTEYRSSI